MTDDLRALAERLEGATGADDALDLEIARALGEPVMYFRLVGEDDRGASAGPYTSSLDAAVALCERVLEGCHWSVTNAATKPRANVWMPEVIRPIMGPYSSAPTPALALCLAIVRAKLGESHE